MTQKNTKSVTFYIIYILGILLLLEVCLRICFPLPELSNFNRINYQILDRQDDKSGYLRNIEMIWKSSPDTSHAFVHDLNRYGFRDKHEWKAGNSDKKKFLFIGDSFVEGMMSTGEKTIPASFENEAVKKYEAEVYNAGMMGIGLNEYIKFIKDAVPVFKPDELIMVLYSNDIPFQREYKAQKSLVPVKSNVLKPRLLTIIQHIQKDDPIPFRFSPEERPFYKAIPDPSNPWTYQENNLKQEVSPKLAEAMKQGDFNFFRTNWVLEENKFLKSDTDVSRKLEFIQAFLKKNDVGFTLFYIPSRSQVTNYYYQFDRQSCLKKCPDFLDLTGEEYQKHARNIKTICDRSGIRFMDFTPLIREKEAKGQHLYWNYDDHMRGNSYVMLGKEIFKFWESGKKNS